MSFESFELVFGMRPFLLYVPFFSSLLAGWPNKIRNGQNLILAVTDSPPNR